MACNLISNVCILYSRKHKTWCAHEAWICVEFKSNLNVYHEFGKLVLKKIWDIIHTYGMFSFILLYYVDERSKACGSRNLFLLHKLLIMINSNCLLVAGNARKLNHPATHHYSCEYTIRNVCPHLPPTSGRYDIKTFRVILCINTGNILIAVLLHRRVSVTTECRHNVLLCVYTYICSMFHSASFMWFNSSISI